jgi:hypothetical protein
VADAQAPRKSVNSTLTAAFAGTLIAALKSAAKRIAPSRAEASLRAFILCSPCLQIILIAINQAPRK